MKTRQRAGIRPIEKGKQENLADENEAEGRYPPDRKGETGKSSG